MGEGWIREKEGEAEAEAEWERDFNRKTVTGQVAKGAPKKLQSGIGKRGEISQPGLPAQPDSEGSKPRAAIRWVGQGALNLGTNLWRGRTAWVP